MIGLAVGIDCASSILIGLALVLLMLVLRSLQVPLTATLGFPYLLAEKAWYLARWLDRLLPEVDVEGRGSRSRAPARLARRRPGRPTGQGVTAPVS